MTQRKKTKEELYLLKTYELAQALGDPEHELDRYTVAAEVGMNPRSVDNIVQLLVRNNMMKRGEETKVYLTPFGINFIKDLLSSKP